MKLQPTAGLAGFLGRQVARVLADRARAPVSDAVHAVRGLTGPVARAFVDSFLAERIVTAAWPSIAVLCAIASIHALSLIAVSPEHARILTGLIVLAAFGFSTYGVIEGVRGIVPHTRIWFVTGLSPTRHARLLIFQWVRTRYAAILARSKDTDFTRDLVAAGIVEFQKAHRLGPNEVAFVLADDLAPVLVRHLLRRAAVLLAPLIAAFLYYRLAIYPDIIARYTTIGPWRIALYPLAAVADTVLQTHLRMSLQGP